MTITCYVYYRVSEDRRTNASEATQRLAELIRERTGVVSRLMTKVDEPSLWMEIYEGIGETTAFLSCLQECLDQTGLERCLQSDNARHIEIFQCA